MEQALKRLKEQTKYQLFHYPETTKKQDIKYLIKRVVRRAHTPKRDAFFWPHALLTQSLETAGDVETLKNYYDLWIEKGVPLHNIDNVMNGYSLLYVYEMTKEDKYKIAADKLYEYMMQYSNDMGGKVPYRKGNPCHIYVDGLGMTVPFLCRYGAIFDKKEAIDLGVKQIQEFLRFGMDSATGLPYHGYDLKTGVKQGIIGWGRGLGWLLLAMVDSIEYLPVGEHREEMIKTFSKLVVNTLPYIREDGYFSWQVTAKEGPKDTSATAMIGYALKKGRIYLSFEKKQERPALEYGDKRISLMDEVLQRIETALISSCSNGKIYHCSGECHGFSQYPQVYGTYPWSQGPAVRFLML